MGIRGTAGAFSSRSSWCHSCSLPAFTAVLLLLWQQLSQLPSVKFHSWHSQVSPPQSPMSTSKVLSFSSRSSWPYNFTQSTSTYPFFSQQLMSQLLSVDFYNCRSFRLDISCCHSPSLSTATRQSLFLATAFKAAFTGGLCRLTQLSLFRLAASAVTAALSTRTAVNLLSRSICNSQLLCQLPQLPLFPLESAAVIGRNHFAVPSLSKKT